ncbi:hypothetical protein H4219_003734 [Mycoemilia scoparia]|uniref:Uncharacterized protein n=1 Tax=Mycoemilia scoparia TaxID=417184 RepID=A0A9W8DS84_9FUNG|nr:hypothetical protein H4219_003734 [Mycoemilia scoparia]
MVSSSGQDSGNTRAVVASATPSGIGHLYTPQLTLTKGEGQDARDELTSLSATFMDMLNLHGRFKGNELSSILEDISFIARIPGEKAGTESFAYPEHKFVMYDLAVEFLGRATLLIKEIVSEIDSNVNTQLGILSSSSFAINTVNNSNMRSKCLHVLVYMYYCAETSINNLMVFGSNACPVSVQYPSELSSSLSSGKSSTKTKTKTQNIDFYSLVLSHLSAYRYIVADVLPASHDMCFSGTDTYPQITTTSPLNKAIEEVKTIVDYYRTLVDSNNQDVMEITNTKLDIDLEFSTSTKAVPSSEQESGNRPNPSAPRVIPVDGKKKGQKA